MFIGILLLLLGVLMLLQQMGIITGSVWEYFWPVIVVAVGVYLILKGRTKAD